MRAIPIARTTCTMTEMTKGFDGRRVRVVSGAGFRDPRRVCIRARLRSGPDAQARENTTGARSGFAQALGRSDEGNPKESFPSLSER